MLDQYYQVSTDNILLMYIAIYLEILVYVVVKLV